MNILRNVIPDRPSSIMVCRILSSALGLINAPLIARSLGPEGRGITAAAIAAFFLIPIVLSLGLPLEVRRVATSQKATNVVRTVRVFASLALPLAFVLGYVIDSFFFMTLTNNERALVIVGISLAPLMICWMCDEGVLLAQERFRSVAILQMTQPVVNTVLVIVGASSGHLSVSWVLCAYMAGLTATAIVGWCQVRVPLRGPRYPIAKLLRGGLSFAGSSVSEAMANRIDQVITLPLIGGLQSGLYAVAVTIATIPIGLAHALGASQFKAIARSASGSTRSAQQKAVRSSLGLGFIFCFSLALGSPLAVSILFGDAFSSAVLPVCILLGGTVFMIGSYVASTALVAGNAGYRMTAAQALGAVAGVAALFLLGPTYGATGAAASASMGYAVTFALLISFIGGPSISYIPRPKDSLQALKDLFGARS